MKGEQWKQYMATKANSIKTLLSLDDQVLSLEKDISTQENNLSDMREAFANLSRERDRLKSRPDLAGIDLDVLRAVVLIIEDQS